MDLTPKEVKRAQTIAKRLKALEKANRVLPSRLQKLYRTYQDKWVAELQGYYDKKYGTPVFQTPELTKAMALLTVFDLHKQCPSYMWGMMPGKQELYELIKNSTGVELWDTTTKTEPRSRRSKDTVEPTGCSAR
jgi:hypothetical protein